MHLKQKLLPLFVLIAAAGTLSARQRVSVAASFGYGPPPPVAVYYGPPPGAYMSVASRCPGPGYAWIPGYWQPARTRWQWRPGAWIRAPYARAVWVGPRYHRAKFHGGYWRR